MNTLFLIIVGIATPVAMLAMTAAVVVYFFKFVFWLAK